MLTRLLALAIAAGLGAGFVLRIALGRARFGSVATVAIALLPLHAATVAWTAVRADVGSVTVALFLVAALVVAAMGTWAARSWAVTRPWLAAFTPLVTGLVYAAVPLLVLVVVVLRDRQWALDVVPAVTYGTLTIFAVAALLPFVPEAPERRTRRRLDDGER
ncbi:MAG: hypothetical protein R6W77_05555 [Trueperaceae bacterium]